MSTPLKTLIIEDSEDDAALLLIALEEGGFQSIHQRVETSEEMAAALESQSWDVVLSDYMMPRFDALAALSILKEKKRDIPFIIVSGKIGEETATAAMRAGADDYLMKDNLTRLSETVRREMKEAANRAALRRAESLLRKSEEKYREFFEGDLSGDFVAIPEGKILICNPAFAGIFGFGSSDEAARYDLKSLYPTRRDWERFIETLREKGSLKGHELEMRRRDGARVDLLGNVVGRFDARGGLIEFKGYLLDTTERKALERQLFQSQKMESLGRLASGIAHDFNNVLTGILGYADLSLARIDDRHPIHAYLSHIRQLAGRAARITRQLLAFSRRQPLERAPVNLNAAVSDLLPLLAKMLGEQAEIVFSPDPNLKNVDADLAQMEQVVLNLCINARDAMPKGGRITLATKNRFLSESDCRSAPCVRPGDYVVLTVSDTGTGMDEKTLERIFEPFFSTKGPEHGTGLGLSIVHGAVGQHGGWVGVESRPGEGSTFSVFLPATERLRRPSADQETALPNTPRRTEKILVVEDDPLLRGVLQLALERSGHVVLLAENGEEGLLQARRHAGAIALIVSDIVMPKMSGRELYEQVQRVLPGIKFLFISGYTDLLTYQGWIAKNRLPLLLKPFSPAELVAKVREFLEPPLSETKAAA